MGTEYDVFKIRERYALLKGQKAAADEEMYTLDRIPCPNCNGKGRIEREDETMPNNYLSKQCEICDGTGKAIGNIR